MKSVFLIPLALLLSSCNPVQDSPTAPTPLPVAAPATAPARPAPTGPPFSLSLRTGTSTVYPGMAVILVTVTAGELHTERPALLTLTCSGRTIVTEGGFGTMPITCDFPEPGAYSVQATMTGSAGFSASAATSVSVLAPQVQRLEVFYSLYDSITGANFVIFGTRAVEGASKYAWDFGDGATVETLLPQTQPHRFENPSKERVVTVTATDAAGRTRATGQVIGRW